VKRIIGRCQSHFRTQCFDSSQHSPFLCRLVGHKRRRASQVVPKGREEFRRKRRCRSKPLSFQVRLFFPSTLSPLPCKGRRSFDRPRPAGESHRRWRPGHPFRVNFGFFQNLPGRQVPRLRWPVRGPALQKPDLSWGGFSSFIIRCASWQVLKSRCNRGSRSDSYSISFRLLIFSSFGFPSLHIPYYFSPSPQYLRPTRSNFTTSWGFP